MPRPQDEPLYATTAALGGYFTVTFKKVINKDGSGHASSHTGYSEEFFDDYRGSGIPLIDFRTCTDLSKALRGVSGVLEASLLGAGMTPSNYPPLDKYIEQCREAGCTITEL
jgi:hypothetical protein